MNSERRRTRPWVAVPPQQGRRFVVTGGGGGLGLMLTRILASREASVVIGVRDPSRARTAIADFPDTWRARVSPRRLDLADLASVEAFASSIADDGGADVLVNNAGIMAVPLETTPEGVELQLATNHLGHFALTCRLLPTLNDRVVVVSSLAHRRGVLDLDDLDWSRRGYRPMAAYAQSKLANLLFLDELQRRLTALDSPLRAVAAHPGSTATGITSKVGQGWMSWVGSWGHHLVGMPVWRGALPLAYAATMDVPGGSFVGPHGPGGMFGWPTLVARSATSSDPELAAALWESSARLSGVTFPL